MEASQTVAAIAGTVCAIFILLTYLHAIKKDCFSYYLGRSPPSTPTPSQIHNSTGGPTSAVIPSPPAIEFSKTRSGGSEDCAVCLGEFSEGESVSLLPNCSHIFHASCIDVWFRSHSSCPLCRNDVVLDLGSSSTFSSLDISQKDSTEIRYEQSREAAGLQ